MNNEIVSLLTLPAETLAILASGYLGYRLAYTGKDKSHKAADVVFLTLVFGLVAKLVLTSLELPQELLLLEVASAILTSAAVSALWRFWGQRKTAKLLRTGRISTHDRHQTALDSLMSDDGMKLSQIVVHLQDGRSLMCDDLFAFETTRTGPSYFGADGSVALYVTHRRTALTSTWEDVSDDITSDDGGMLITVIPADQIAYTQMRAS